jgi:hypothetical protein
LILSVLKGTVGQSPPTTKYINERGRTNKLTKYVKGGKRTPNQQSGTGGANRTNYTSGKGSSPKKRRKKQKREELESLRPNSRRERHPREPQSKLRCTDAGSF